MRVLADLLADLRFGARLLARNPGFTAVAALSLALGIGGATSIFTLIDAVVLRALPVPRPSELYYVQFQRPGSAMPGRNERVSWPMYEDVRSALAGRVEVCATTRVARMLVTDRARGAAQGEMLRVQLVSGECFTTLRQSPQVGRLLTPPDNRTLDGHAVAVISDGYWNRAFGRAPDIVSHDLAVNGTTVTVVGVAPTGFFGTSIDQTTDIWMPSMMQHSLRYRGNVSDHNADVSQPWSPQRGVFWLTLFLRIPDASTRAAIESRTDAIAQQHFSALTTGAPRGGAFGGVHATLQPGDRGISRLRTVMQNPLVVLLTMVSLLLLIACANIAGLLLARSTARQRELAVRIAIGASARRLLRQLLAESLLLSLVGGALGVLAARWGTDALLALFSSSTSSTAVDTSLDLRVLRFAFLLSILTGLAFGLLPAARAARLSPADALAAASRGMVAGTSAPGRIPLGRLLVGAQLAVTVLLLSVAALFGRTLQQLANVDLGYARGQILLVGIDPVAAGYTPGRLPALYDSLAARLGALPSVISTSLSADGPLSGSRRLSALTVEGYDPGPDEEVHVQENTVTPAYFKTLGIELVAGRTFGSQDVAGGRLVAVVNETMARRYFRHGAVLGKRIAYDADLAGGFEIIGVVRDARYNDLRGATPDLVYRPVAQTAEVLSDIEVRTSSRTADIAPEVRRLIAEIDPGLPVLQTTTLEERVVEQTSQERLLALLTAVFGAAAVLLACIGLYGTMAYGVSRRTAEIGVRIALGASRANVVWLVMREALLILSAGLALGLALALVAAGRLGELLYNVPATDPVSHITAVVALGVVAVMAAWLPARRAARLDPTTALRTE